MELPNGWSTARPSPGSPHSYDAEGKTSGSNSAVYTRDPLGQRVRKDVGTRATEYYYFGGQLMATRDPSSGQWTDYIYAGNRLIAENPGTATAAPIYRIGDHLDSLAQKQDASGNLLGANDFSPYGELVSSSAPDLFLFTQDERDAENSTDSTLFRQYASTQGRWLSPDPYSGSYDLTDPQSLNRYAYLGGRPQASVDSSGLIESGIDPGDGGGEFGGALGFLLNLFGFLGSLGGGGGPHQGPSSTVDTGYGNPYDTNGTTVFPEYVSQLSSDPGSLGESLGIPLSIPHGVWGIGPAFGLPTDTCEFGACGFGSTTSGAGNNSIGGVVNLGVAYDAVRVGLLDVAKYTACSLVGAGKGLNSFFGLPAGYQSGPPGPSSDVRAARGIYKIGAPGVMYELSRVGPVARAVGDLIPGAGEILIVGQGTIATYDGTKALNDCVSKVR